MIIGKSCFLLLHVIVIVIGKLCVTASDISDLGYQNADEEKCVEF